ncbi:hypothetical protein SDC9_161227 [bioreactor metagenome]|uniref:Uncharacterized protein n=1 Tax=bioreactor metagenome TaxID=1076179 RepID=A0A645FHP1_9ZZZZ
MASLADHLVYRARVAEVEGLDAAPRREEVIVRVGEARKDIASLHIKDHRSGVAFRKYLFIGPQRLDDAAAREDRLRAPGIGHRVYHAVYQRYGVCSDALCHFLKNSSAFSIDYSSLTSSASVRAPKPEAPFT